MQQKKVIIKITIFILLVAAIIFAEIYNLGEHLTFENLKKNRDLLKDLAKEHYLLSITAYILLYISTAFFVPGAIPLTVIGGFLFGVFWGTLYVCIGAITGATLAFFTARYLVGEWLQDKYKDHLRRFNKQIEKYGYYYLILIRLTPLIPFFLINYLAGLTRVPFRIFLLTFLVTLLPGTIIYTFAGQYLGAIESLEDLISVETSLIALLLLTIAILSLILYKHIKDNPIRLKV